MSWGKLNAGIDVLRRERRFKLDNHLLSAEYSFEGLTGGNFEKFFFDKEYAEKIFHDMTEPFTHIDQLMGKMIERHFQEKKNFDGTPWAPLSQKSTLRLRAMDISRIGSGGIKWRGNKGRTKGKYVFARGDRRGKRPSPMSTTRALWATMDYFRAATSVRNRFYIFNAKGSSWKRHKRIQRGTNEKQAVNEFGIESIGGKRLGSPFHGKSVPAREAIYFDSDAIEESVSIIFDFIDKAFS